jgi:ATP-dependent Clp protease ATP-binding subunit ClpC
MYERFKDYPNVQRMLNLARTESLRLNHKYVGSEHLLLAIINEEEHEKEGVAGKVLENMGLNLSKIRASIELVIGPGKWVALTTGVSESCKWAIDFAILEKREFYHELIDSEHILLGFLHVPETVAAEVLESYGVTLRKARAEVERLHPTYVVVLGNKGKATT